MIMEFIPFPICFHDRQEELMLVPGVFLFEVRADIFLYCMLLSDGFDRL